MSSRIRPKWAVRRPVNWLFPVLPAAALAVAVLGSRAGSYRQSQPVNPPTSSSSSPAPARTHTLPAGTILYLRLETPVSTTSSNLNGPVTATVVREVSDNGNVIVPLGAKVTGIVARLIPSSNPKDRAKMLLRFDHLLLPGRPPLILAGHVTAVENARETVSSTGEIIGVLASEVPASLINSALGKIGQPKGQSGQASSNPPPAWFGQTDTTITYPAGTDLDFSLDKQMVVEGAFPPAFAAELPAGDQSAVLSVLANAPKRASSKTGTPGDPVNLVVIGSEQEIETAFQKAGWTPAARMGGGSLWNAVQAMIKDQGYGSAPVSDLYLFGRKEDLAFEKMLNTMAKRHHIRLWRSGSKTPDGRDIWLAASTHDDGIDIHPGVISHAIDPNLDLERAKVSADLAATGLVAAEQALTPPNPLSGGMTATGGTWKTDGRIVVISLKN